MQYVPLSTSYQLSLEYIRSICRASERRCVVIWLSGEIPVTRLICPSPRARNRWVERCQLAIEDAPQNLNVFVHLVEVGRRSRLTKGGRRRQRSWLQPWLRACILSVQKSRRKNNGEQNH